MNIKKWPELTDKISLDNLKSYAENLEKIEINDQNILSVINDTDLIISEIEECLLNLIKDLEKNETND